MLIRRLLILVSSTFALASIACGGSTVSSGTGGNGQGGSGGAGGGGVSHEELFACGIAPSCETMSVHINPEPASALTCSAKLVVSGTPGVLSAIDVPGPYFYETERFILLLGDGKALVQSRHRECMDVCPEPVPWEPSSAHQICEVVVPEGLSAACEAASDMGCQWSPWGGLKGCQDVPDRTCADVSSALGSP